MQLQQGKDFLVDNIGISCTICGTVVLFIKVYRCINDLVKIQVNKNRKWCLQLCKHVENSNNHKIFANLCVINSTHLWEYFCFVPQFIKFTVVLRGVTFTLCKTRIQLLQTSQSVRAKYSVLKCQKAAISPVSHLPCGWSSWVFGAITIFGSAIIP